MDLSESLVKEAKVRGLLETPAIKRMLLAEIKRERVEKLFASANKLASQETPSMTGEELQQEIKASREQRRNLNPSGR